MDRKQRFLTYFSTALFAGILFIALYGHHVLNPENTAWLFQRGDLPEHYLGWKAYRHSARHFPIGMIDGLTYPEPVSLIYTDSIPLFAIFCKLLSPLLPETFQYFGIYGLLCFMLQGIFAVRILEHFCSNSLLTVLFSLLFIPVPAMLYRMFYHTALAGHWLLLLTLEPLFAYEHYREKGRVLCRLAALSGALCALTTSYFVIPCGIILCGVCLLDILSRRDLKRSLFILGSFSLTFLLTAGLIGGFGTGRSLQSGGLGFYSFNLNSILNPQGWSVLLPDLPLYTEGQYEGFCYPGVAWLFLAFFALLLFFSEEKEKRALLRKLGKKPYALLAVFLFSILCAVSPQVTFGNRLLLTLNLPDWLMNIWSIFRSSGRLAWPASYLVLISTCLLLIRYMSPKTLAVLLCLAISVQLYDMHGKLEEIFGYFGNQQARTADYQARAPQIAQEDAARLKHILYAEPITWQENYHRYSTVYPLTDWALSRGITLSDFYTARSLTDIETQKARIQALIQQPREDTLIVYPTGSEFLLDLNHYHCYSHADAILCAVGPLKNLPEITEVDRQSKVWHFGNGEHLSENGGRDTEQGRILYPRGLSYGPYWKLNPGNYLIQITGRDFPQQGMDILLQSEGGAVQHAFDFADSADEAGTFILHLEIEQTVTDFEVMIRNNSAMAFTLTCIEIQRLETEGSTQEN